MALRQQPRGAIQASICPRLSYLPKGGPRVRAETPKSARASRRLSGSRGPESRYPLEWYRKRRADRPALPSASADGAQPTRLLPCGGPSAGPQFRSFAVARSALSLEPLQMVLQPASHGIEGITDRYIQVAMRLLRPWFLVHHDRPT